MQSQWIRQERGTRQGCPLSPYLLLVAMSAMWADIREDLRFAGETLGLAEVDIGEILYADDTAVVTDSAARATKVLQIIEINATHFGLRLNRGKCEVLMFGEPGAEVRFDDGTGMAQPQSAKYIGCQIYASGDVGK